MAAEISDSLQRELRIVELEAAFRENQPIDRPRKTWTLTFIVAVFLLGAIWAWLAGFPASASLSLGVVVFFLVDHQRSKQANKLYDCGTEVIEYYKSKSRTGAQAHHPE